MTAEDTTPSEREAPQRFAWWHPQSADLGRRAEARRQHARRNDLWARPTACEAPIIPRPLPPPSTSTVFAVIDGPVFAPVDPPTPHALARRAAAAPPPPPVEPSTAAAAGATKPPTLAAPKKPDWLAIEPKKPASKPRGRRGVPASAVPALAVDDAVDDALAELSDDALVATVEQATDRADREDGAAAPKKPASKPHGRRSRAASPKKPAEEDVDALVARDAPIERTEKPRRGRGRPASVEAATTTREYLARGGTKPDLKYDLKGGFFRVRTAAALAPAAEAPTAPAEETVAAARPAEKSKKPRGRAPRGATWDYARGQWVGAASDEAPCSQDTVPCSQDALEPDALDAVLPTPSTRPSRPEPNALEPYEAAEPTPREEDGTESVDLDAEPPARPSTVPEDAAPSEDGLAVGDRITMGGAPGTVVALPERGWWKLRLDGEETVRSARRTKFAPAAAEEVEAPAPKKQRGRPPKASAPAPPKARKDDELGVGARVALDGTAGEVVEKGEKGWWKVRVDGEGTLRSARAGKLTVLAADAEPATIGTEWDATPTETVAGDEEEAGPPRPGSRVTVRFSDGINYAGTVERIVDESHAFVQYDDGQSETVRFPDPDVRVRRVGPAPGAHDLAVGDRVAMGGAEGVITALPDKGWWKVRLDGETTVRSARRNQLTRLDATPDTIAQPAPAAPVAAPALPEVVAPASPAPPAPAAAPHSSTKSDEAIAKALQEEAPPRGRGGARGRGLEMRRVGDAAWRPFASQKDAATAFGLRPDDVSKLVTDRTKASAKARAFEVKGGNTGVNVDAAPPAAAPDFAVGARVALDGAPGVVTALPERGWWKVRLDGEEAVRSCRRPKLTPLDEESAAPAPPAPAAEAPAAPPEEVAPTITKGGLAPPPSPPDSDDEPVGILPRPSGVPEAAPPAHDLAPDAEAPAAAPEDAAPTEDDLAVGDRITMGGASGTVVALPERGWWKLRLDGEEAVRSARRTKFAPLGGEAPPPAPADEPPAPAPAPTPQEDRRKAGVEMRRVGDTAWRCFKSQKDAANAFGLSQGDVSRLISKNDKVAALATRFEARKACPTKATEPAAAPTYDLAVGDRIAFGGRTGVVAALPVNTWWKVRLNGEERLRSARRCELLALDEDGEAKTPDTIAQAPPPRSPPKSLANHNVPGPAWAPAPAPGDDDASRISSDDGGEANLIGRRVVIPQEHGGGYGMIETIIDGICDVALEADPAGDCLALHVDELAFASDEDYVGAPAPGEGADDDEASVPPSPSFDINETPAPAPSPPKALPWRPELQREAWRAGDWCIAIRDHDWHTGSAYYGLVAKENADGTFAVHYDDGHVQPDVRKDELRCLDRENGTCALPGSKRDMTPGSRGAELVGDAWRAQQLAMYGPKKSSKKKWTAAEEDMLRALAEEKERDETMTWEQVAERLDSGRSASAVEQHWLKAVKAKASPPLPPAPRWAGVPPVNIAAPRPPAPAAPRTVVVAPAPGKEAALRAELERLKAANEPTKPTFGSPAPQLHGMKRVNKSKGGRWGPEEEAKLRDLIEERRPAGSKDWGQIGELLGGRSASATQQHWEIMQGKRKKSGKMTAPAPPQNVLDAAPPPPTVPPPPAPAAAPKPPPAPRVEKEKKERAPHMCLAPYMSESCTCIQENPRRANTKPYNSYEAYKAGTTLQGVLDLGAKKADLAHDLARKYITLDDPEKQAELLAKLSKAEAAVKKRKAEAAGDQPKPKRQSIPSRWTPDEDAALRRLHAEHSKTRSKDGESKWDVIAAAIGTRRTASAAEHRWAIIKNKNAPASPSTAAAPAPAAPLDVLAAASPPPAKRLPAAFPEAPAAPQNVLDAAPPPPPSAAKKRGRDGDNFEFDGDGADAAKPKKPAVRVCKKPRASAKPTAGATEREGPIPNDGSFLETMKKRFAKARADAPAPAAPASPLDDSSLRGPPG